MDQPASAGYHVFVVKIWLEETAAEAGRATWRGSLTHLPWGERRYLSDLKEIAIMVAPYLDEMGVRLGPRWRFKRWFRGEPAMNAASGQRRRLESLPLGRVVQRDLAGSEAVTLLRPREQHDQPRGEEHGDQRDGTKVP